MFFLIVCLFLGIGGGSYGRSVCASIAASRFSGVVLGGFTCVFNEFLIFSLFSFILVLRVPISVITDSTSSLLTISFLLNL